MTARPPVKKKKKTTATKKGHPFKKPSKKMDDQKSASEHAKVNGELSSQPADTANSHAPPMLDLLQMQIRELLQELSVSPVRKKKIDHFVDLLKAHLLGLFRGELRKLTDQSFLRQVKVPLLQEPFEDKGHFQFLPPREVKLVGTYALGLAIKNDLVVTLAAEMPAEVFNERKDVVNWRFFRKRALYLACIADQLISQEQPIGELQFTYLHGDYMRPVIVLTPSVEFGFKFQLKVHIDAYAQEGAIRLLRFHIRKNNVRASWFLGEKQSTELKPCSDNDDGLLPTKIHNTTALACLLLARHTEFLQDTFSGCPTICDGVKLCKVWLRQLSLSSTDGSSLVTDHIIEMLLAYLVHEKLIQSVMSAHHVFKSILSFLASDVWTTESVISLCKTPDEAAPRVADFQSLFRVVFIDPSGYYNLTSTWSKLTLWELKSCAARSLALWQRQEPRMFQDLFLVKRTFALTHDHVVHIKGIVQASQLQATRDVHPRLIAHCEYLILPELVGVIERSIGWRLHSFDVRFPEASTWPVNKDCPKPWHLEHSCVSFGLQLRTDRASAQLDRGPPASSSEAIDFRKFWGEKSELRRFQDGEICEAAVWPASTVAEKRIIFQSALTYALQCNAHIDPGNIAYMGAQTDALLALPKSPKVEILYSTGEEQHTQFLQAFEDLTKILRASTDDLSFSIHHVQGVSAVFRYSSVFPPLQATFKSPGRAAREQILPLAGHPCPPYVPACQVVCMLEGGVHWPGEFEAVRAKLTIFMEELGELLSTKHSLTCSAYPHHLDVFYRCYVFRIVLGCIQLIMAARKAEELGTAGATGASLTESLQHDLVTMPRYTSLLHGVYQRWNAFSGASRLLKRWAAAHLLLNDYISEECLELLTAHTFLHPEPLTALGSPLVGFARALLLIASHDWQGSPLFVDFREEFTHEDLKDISEDFVKNRHNFPPMFISTPLNRLTPLWISERLDKVILHRLVKLAKMSLCAVENVYSGADDIKKVFRTSYASFSGLIHLERRSICRAYQAIDPPLDVFVPRYRPLDDSLLASSHTLPVVEFDPVQLFLQELRSVFSEKVLFFYDCFGGDRIAFLFKPDAPEKSPSAESDADCPPHRHVTHGAILQDFMNMGKGLVTRIECGSLSST